MILQETPYINFSTNPYTDILTENWITIRNQFIDLCKIESLRDDSGWIDAPTGLKPNGDTSSHFPGMLYEGTFKTVCVMIKDNMIDNVSDFFADEFDKLLDL